jgi:integral membrane protein
MSYDLEAKLTSSGEKKSERGSLVRPVGIIEGISYVLLLGVAMPLKYVADMPLAVRIAGSAHGLLFVLFVVVLVWEVVRGRWSFERASMAFGASLVPFGTFIMDLHDPTPRE